MGFSFGFFAGFAISLVTGTPLCQTVVAAVATSCTLELIGRLVCAGLNRWIWKV